MNGGLQSCYTHTSAEKETNFLASERRDRRNATDNGVYTHVHWLHRVFKWDRMDSYQFTEKRETLKRTTTPMIC